MSTAIDSKQKLVRAKFNFAQMNPKYDAQRALKMAKEEKSHIVYTAQRAIDYAMVDFVYEAGKVYDIPEDLFNKLSNKTVETYNPLFGSFQGQSLSLIDRPEIPYILKVDNDGNLLNPMDQKLDLYPKKVEVKVEEHVGSIKKKKKVK